MSADPVPYAAQLEVTSIDEIRTMPILLLNVHENCNCKCTMCDIWKRPAGAEFPLHQLRSFQEDIRSLKIEQVVLTGGEPLLHSQFGELCQILKGCNVRITLLSTGLLLKKRADLIADSVDEIIVSLDGPPSTHDAIRRIPRAYQLMHDGIIAIRQFRPDMAVHARSTIQSANFPLLRKTVAAAKTLKCNSISFLPVDTTSQAFNRELIWPRGYGGDIGLTSEQVSLLEEEIELLITCNEDDIRDRYILENPAKLRRIANYFRGCLGETSLVSPICNAPWVSTVVEVDGTVRPCFFHRKIATTMDQSLKYAINSPDARRFRETLDITHNPICRRCVCSLNYQQRAAQDAKSPE